ncbi:MULTISPECIES: hypothetical protein [unclassified Mesorhizobium]|uniref:hypothetical protein n=1 Tax=unclassified Mesorhizobium TaxID=325217 RepID=UPI00167353A0|nr:MULTISPECIES: hypothetical protein [unclassified Mesorhizobium]
MAHPTETQHKFGRKITTVAITVGMRPAILLPQDEQGDTGLLELDRKIGPVLFCASSRALFDAVASEELVLKRIVGQPPGKGQLNPIAAARCKLSCTVLRAIPNTTAISRELVPLRQAAAFVVTVSWSAFSLPASKSPGSSRGI